LRTKVDSNPIAPRLRRKHQRLPPSLLIENASDRVPLRCESVLPEAFPLKASAKPGAIAILFQTNLRSAATFSRTYPAEWNGYFESMRWRLPIYFSIGSVMRSRPRLHHVHDDKGQLRRPKGVPPDLFAQA
jgi:hypothetical protein